MRGLKKKLIIENSNPELIPGNTQNQINNNTSNNNIINIKNTEFKYLFEINDDIINKGADIFFNIKDNNVFNQNLQEGTKINIGNNFLFYIEEEEDTKNIKASLLQEFINNHISDILVLLTIECFLDKNNINMIIQDNSTLTHEAIKFKNNYYENNGYNIIKMLENNIPLYKEILLMSIINILDANNHKNKFIFILLYEKWIKDNKFFDNYSFKKRVFNQN